MSNTAVARGGEWESIRRRRRRVGRAVAAGVGALAIMWLSVRPVLASASGSVSVTCTDNPAGDTPALQNALASAQKANGTVSIAAGTCALNDRLVAAKAVTIDGAGQGATFLVQQAHSNIFQITGDGVTVENMNLDTATFNASPPVPKNPNPAVLFSNANQTTVTDVTAEAGSGYGMRFVGPSPCAHDLRGGDTIGSVDITTTGTGGFAAIDVSCQNGASLSDLAIHGGVLALFEDQNVTVRGETFTPGPNAKTCAPPWFVTGPAQDISIGPVTSAGGPGIVDRPVTNITITDQTVTNPACS